MSYDIGARIGIEGATEFKHALSEINAVLRTNKTELQAVASAYDENDKSAERLRKENEVLAKQLARLREEQQRAAAAIEFATEKYGENNTQTLRAQRAYNNVTTEINRMQRQLESNNVALEGTDDAARQAASGFEDMGNSAGKSGDAVDALAKAIAATGLVKAVKELADAMWSAVDASVEFESALAGVYKTVDGTDAQLKAISDGIKQLSTVIPASTTEIAAVAEAAGQLGIATDDILHFTEVMIKLGTATNLSAEDAATALARFANITGMSADNYDRLGSAIVALGNNFATTESEITEMATRLASAGTLAGLTEAQILALSAAMSSVGIQAEAGGTAMTQTLTAIEKAVTRGGEKLQTFARIAGMTANEFKTAWRADAIVALQAFITGLGSLESGGKNATQVLEELGLSGIRQSNMLKSLSLASEELTRAIDLSAQAWTENIALTKEAEQRYSTTESKFKLLENSVTLLKQSIGDALTPALANLAETGAEVSQWAAEFAANNTELVQGVAALTIGLGAFAGTVGGIVAVTKAIEALKIALAATVSPMGLIGAAIAGVTAALIAINATAEDTTAHVKELTKEVSASAKAFEENVASINSGVDNITLLAAQAEELASKTNLTSAEMSVLSDIIDQLNASVPGLNLAYDELNGTLAMTAEQIIAVAEAQAKQQYIEETIKRRLELEAQERQLIKELAAANDELAKAQSDAQASLDPEHFREAQSKVYEWNAAIRDLEASLTGVRGELVGVNEEIDAYKDSVEANTDALAKNALQTVENIDFASEYASRLDELAEKNKELTATSDMLAGALKEQKDAGTLSLQTINDLIEAGYAAALQINEETGAVTLNKEAYIGLAQAKIDEQIASLTLQRDELAEKLRQESQAAITLASTTMDVAVAKYAQAAATAALKSAEEGTLKSYDANIAALQKLRDNLGKVTGSSGNAAKKVKTAAQQSLEAYQALEKELSHQRAMGLVEESEYYRKLAEYRDEYLTNTDSLDQYRKVTEQIHKYEEQMLDASLKSYKDHLEGISKTFSKTLDEIESQIADVEKQRDALAERLADYGDLYAVSKSGRVILGDLQKQTDAIKEYSDVLQKLREAGASDEFLAEVIASGDVEEVTKYGKKLLELGDGLNEYFDAWEEKQKIAKEVAENFYADQIEALETEYNQKLEEALATLQDTSFASGEDVVQGLIDGMAEREQEVYAKAKEIADNIAKAFSADFSNGAMDFNSIVPSFGANPAGTNLDAAVNRISSIMSGAVNAMSGTNQHLSVELPVYLNGKEIYRASIDDLYAVMSSNPRVVNERI